MRARAELSISRQDVKAGSRDGHKYEIYSVAGSIDTFPNGINNKQVQVGKYQLHPGVYPGFRRYPDQLTQLILQTRAGALSPTAYDINENGTILGVANLDPNDYFPSILIYLHGAYRVLPKDPTVVRTFYAGMREREDLAGLWFNDASAGYLPWSHFASTQATSTSRRAPQPTMKVY